MKIYVIETATKHRGRIRKRVDSVYLTKENAEMRLKTLDFDGDFSYILEYDAADPNSSPDDDKAILTMTYDSSNKFAWWDLLNTTQEDIDETCLIKRLDRELIKTTITLPKEQVLKMSDEEIQTLLSGRIDAFKKDFVGEVGK